MTLADMSVVTAEVKVDETDIVNIQIGQPAEVTVDALPGKVFKGHVTLAGDQALLRSTGVATSQSTTGTEEAKDFKVVVTLDNPSSELRPGLSTTAKITTARKSNVLSLPIQALVMHNPADDKPKSSSGVQAASSSPTPPRACSCRASLWWKRISTANARQIRSRNHRHHRGHRHRGAFRADAGSGSCDRTLQNAAHFEEWRAHQARYRRPGQLRLRRGLGHGEPKAAAPPRASKHQRMRTALRLKAARMPRQFRACGAGPALPERFLPDQFSRSGSASPKLAGHAGGFQP